MGPILRPCRLDGGYRAMGSNATVDFRVIIESVSPTVDVPEGPADSRDTDSWVTTVTSSLAIFCRNADRCR